MAARSANQRHCAGDPNQIDPCHKRWSLFGKRVVQDAAAVLVAGAEQSAIERVLEACIALLQVDDLTLQVVKLVGTAGGLLIRVGRLLLDGIGRTLQLGRVGGRLLGRIG